MGQFTVCYNPGDVIKAYQHYNSFRTAAKVMKRMEEVRPDFKWQVMTKEGYRAEYH